MKKSLLLALSLTAAAYTAQAQAPAAKAATTAGPAIVFEEVKYDFGSVVQGGTVDHTFKFKNTGTAPLIISNIGVSCGCTTPEWTKAPIAPGTTGTIAAGSTTVSLVGEVKEAGTTAAANAAPSVTMTETAATMAAPAAKDNGKKVKEKMGDSKLKMKVK